MRRSIRKVPKGSLQRIDMPLEAVTHNYLFGIFNPPKSEFFSNKYQTMTRRMTPIDI